MRFVIIVDATQATGMGHVSRCLNIANAIRKIDPAVLIVFTGDIMASLEERILRDGFDIRPHLRPTAEDIILHDRYGLDQRAVDGLVNGKARVVFIDDFGLLDLSNADAVLNFRVGAEDMFRYGSRHDLLGVSYLPVPSGLTDVRARQAARGVAQGPPRVLIFIGGGASATDERMLVSAARTASTDAQIRLLSPRSLEHGLSRDIELHTPLGAIAPHLDWATAVLCGGGLLKYEAGYCGLPVACYSQTSGQYEDTVSLVARGLTYDLGLASQTQISILVERLRAFMDQETQADLCNACLETYPPDSGRTLALALLNL